MPLLSLHPPHLEQTCGPCAVLSLYSQAPAVQRSRPVCFPLPPFFPRTFARQKLPPTPETPETPPTQRHEGGRGERVAKDVASLTHPRARCAPRGPVPPSSSPAQQPRSGSLPRAAAPSAAPHSSPTRRPVGPCSSPGCRTAQQQPRPP